jgi:hypothetical protein
MVKSMVPRHLCRRYPIQRPTYPKTCRAYSGDNPAHPCQGWVLLKLFWPQYLQLMSCLADEIAPNTDKLALPENNPNASEMIVINPVAIVNQYVG